MNGFIILVLAIAVIVIKIRLSGRVKRLEERLSYTEDLLSTESERIRLLEQELKTKKGSFKDKNTTVDRESMDKAELRPSEPSESTLSKHQPTGTAEPGSSETESEQPHETDTPESGEKDSEIAQPVSAIGAFWRRIESRIALNWTGIIGTILLVLGIGFLGVYTALKMTEFYRFLMIIGFSGVLAGAFFFLRDKDEWIRLALWMRSAAGAVFLFACLGAGGIPGLHWIHNPGLGLAVLILGICVNLYLSVVGGKQIFASLHVLFALTALSAAPQNGTTLIIASIVTLFGIGLTFRERWDYHLLLSITSFFAYHIYWYFSVGGDKILQGPVNIIGISAVSAVCISAAFVHYRKLYGSKEFEKIPFMVHLINWVYFGFGLLMHVSGQKWKTLPLFLGAGAAFVLAHHARRLKIRWLHCTDTLIAQIVTVIGLISLAEWGVDYDVILTIVFFETLAFTGVLGFVNERILYRAGIAIIQISGVGLAAAIGVTGDLGDTGICLRQSVLAAVSAGACLVFHVYLVRSKDSKLLSFDTYLSMPLTTIREFSVTGVIPGILLLITAVLSQDILWFQYSLSVAAIGLILIRDRIGTNGLTAGSAVLITGMHAVTWYVLYSDPSISGKEILARGIPLFLISLAAVKWDYLCSVKKHAKWFGIYLGTLHFAILTHVLFTPVSPLIPGVAWLLGSILVLETLRFTAGEDNDGNALFRNAESHLLVSGYWLLGLFFIRHILVHLQSEVYVGFLKVRFGIEAFALAVILYWLFTKLPEKVQRSGTWKRIHPLLLEFITVFTVLTISVEVDKYWHPILWLVCGFAALFIGGNHLFSRMKAYSVLFYWASIFQVTFLLGSYDNLGTRWYEQDWILGSAAIAGQFAFLTIFCRVSGLSEVSFPSLLSLLDKPAAAVNRHRSTALFYPLLVCVALFFYWTLAESLLTLAWVLECFAVFVISIILREQHFRYTALTGLGACIIRLIFFDLAQSTTLIKALVFLGVGGLMLGMHVLYNKFRNRLFEEDESEVS